MSDLLSESPTFVPGGGARWRDPFPMYAALRDLDPVHRLPGTEDWVLSRFADVEGAARDTARFSSADGLTLVRDERARAGLDEVAPLVMLDPPEHTDFRRLVAKGFTPRHVTELEPIVRAFVRERLDRIGGDEVDIVQLLFKPLPSMVVAHYLGVPDEDRDRFDAWTEAIVAANAQGSVTSASDAVGELVGYFAEMIELCRGGERDDGGDDVISQLARLGEDRVSTLSVLGFAFTMIAGGNDTTTGLLGGAAELLTRRRDERRRLVDDPALLDGAIEELLRLTSPVQCLARTTTVDVELHDTVVPAGHKVLLMYGAANRDPREFGEDAEELDITRRISRMLAFGHGAHHCLGAAAARLQSKIALQELLGRYPDFTVDADRGAFAPGRFVRRYAELPFLAAG